MSRPVKNPQNQTASAGLSIGPSMEVKNSYKGSLPRSHLLVKDDFFFLFPLLPIDVFKEKIK